MDAIVKKYSKRSHKKVVIKEHLMKFKQFAPILAFGARVILMMACFAIFLGHFYFGIVSPGYPYGEVIQDPSFIPPQAQCDLKYDIEDEISIDSLQGTTNIDREITITPTIYRIWPEFEAELNLSKDLLEVPVYFFEASEPLTIICQLMDSGVYDDPTKMASPLYSIGIVERSQQSNEISTSYGSSAIYLNKTNKLSFKLSVSDMLIESFPEKCFPFDRYILDIQLRFPTVFLLKGGEVRVMRFTLDYYCNIYHPGSVINKQVTGAYYILRRIPSWAPRVLDPWQDISTAHEDLEILGYSPTWVSGDSRVTLDLDLSEYRVGGIRLWISLERPPFFSYVFGILIIVLPLVPPLALVVQGKLSRRTFILEASIIFFFVEVMLSIVLLLSNMIINPVNAMIIFPSFAFFMPLVFHRDSKLGVLGWIALAVMMMSTAYLTDTNLLIWNWHPLNVASVLMIFALMIILADLMRR